jgi:hypothetical protein
MGYYTYNYFLPERVATALTHAVRSFAAERGVQADVWYHGLPTWMVWGQDGTRVDQVQIDAVMVAEGDRLVFTPNAYTDTRTPRDGLTTVTRQTADVEAVRRTRIDVAVADLTAAGGIAIEHNIQESLGEAWRRARELALDHAKSWEYVTDLKPGS